MCFFPLTGRAYLYANEVPVTFKGGCLNSGKGRETVLFVWMEEKEKCEGKGSLPHLASLRPCRIYHIFVFLVIYIIGTNTEGNLLCVFVTKLFCVFAFTHRI